MISIHKVMLLGAVVAATTFTAGPAFTADQPMKQGSDQVQQAPSTLNDAQIAAIVLAANDIDVENGKFAKKHTKDTQVKEFANRMVTDHKGANNQVKHLAKQLKIKPQETDTSKGLKKTADQTRDRMKKLKGAEFDRAYIDNEVTFHQEVMDTIDKQLLPNAQAPELKTLIGNIRSTVESHLQQAKQIQSSLKPS